MTRGSWATEHCAVQVRDHVDNTSETKSIDCPRAVHGFLDDGRLVLVSSESQLVIIDLATGTTTAAGTVASGQVFVVGSVIIAWAQIDGVRRVMTFDASGELLDSTEVGPRSTLAGYLSLSD